MSDPVQKVAKRIDETWVIDPGAHPRHRAVNQRLEVDHVAGPVERLGPGHTPVEGLRPTQDRGTGGPEVPHEAILTTFGVAARAGDLELAGPAVKEIEAVVSAARAGELDPHAMFSHQDRGLSGEEPGPTATGSGGGDRAVDLELAEPARQVTGGGRRDVRLDVGERDDAHLGSADVVAIE